MTNAFDLRAPVAAPRLCTSPTPPRGPGRRARLGGALALALLGLALPAQAQIVNVSSLAGQAVEQGLSGNANLSVDFRTGNVQLMLASAAATAFYRVGDNTFMLSANGAYGLNGPPGEWKDEPFRERTFEHFRFRRQVNSLVSLEAFVQHEYDRWRRLKLRGLAGGGVRLDHKLSEDNAVAGGLAYMAQVEQLLKPTAADPSGRYLEHRISTYLTGSHKLAEKSAVTATVYFQPMIGAFTDIRALLDLGLIVGITDTLGVKISYALSWDSDPPDGVFGTEHTSLVAITWAF